MTYIRAQGFTHPTTESLFMIEWFTEGTGAVAPQKHKFHIYISAP